MIRFLHLFLRLRWQLLMGALRSARQKGGVAAFGALVGVLAPVFVGFFLIVMASFLALLCWKAGAVLVGDDDGPRGVALLVLRFVLGLGTGLLVVMPAVRASRGASGDAQSGLTRLLLLPLSRRHLHSCEVAANALDPILLLFAPGLVLMGVRVLMLSPVAGSISVLSSLLLLAALGTVAACLAFLLQLLLRNRERSEMVMLVAMVGFIGLGIVPALLERIDERQDALKSESEIAAEAPAPLPALSEEDEKAAKERRRAERERRRIRRAESFPLWLQPLPSEAHARALARATAGRPLAALPSLAWLAAFTGVGWWCSGRLWERLVSSPESGGAGARVDPFSMRIRELPGVDPPVSVVAITTARTFLRTVRGKLALVLTPLTVGFLGFMFGEGSEVVTHTAILVAAKQRLGWIAIFMSLLSLLPVSANAFASDRAGLTLQALTPIGERRLVWGKVLGGVLIYLPCLSLSLLAASLVGGGFAPSSWLGSLFAGLAALAFLLPLATWMSILLPKHADLGVLTQAGNPHQGAQWVVILGSGFVMALVGLADLGGQLLTGSPWGGVLGCLLMALVGLAVAWPLLEAAAGTLEKRREIVLSTAQGR